MPTPCTVTGNLQTLSSGQLPNGSVRFQLSNIGTGNPVGIIGTSLLPVLVQTFATDNTGAFSCSIWGNDNINPANTVYLVTFLDNLGNSLGPVQYSITGASLNLNTAIPGNTTSPPVLIGGPAIVSAPLAAQSITGQPLTLTSTAPLTVAKLDTIRFASQFAGADLGARINAADTDLGATPGEIWVDQSSGTTISTAVSLGANHTLRFVQGGTYTVSAVIAMGQSSVLVAPPASTGVGGVQTQVVLKQANGANLAALVSVNGSYAVVSDITFDGNKGNNTGTVGLLVNLANRVQLRHNTFQNCPSHGVSIQSTGILNQSCCGTMSKNMFIANGGSGLLSTGTADWLADLNEFENNTLYGAEMSDSPTWRWTNNDWGGNTLYGLYIHGTAAGLKSNEHIIVGGQMGNQFQGDLRIVGFDTTGGAVTSTGNIIVGISFIGSANRANNTYSCIELVDGGSDIILGNLFVSGVAPHAAKNGINITETAGGRRSPGTVAPNVFSGTWGTSFYSDGTTGKNMAALNNDGSGFYSLSPNVFIPNNTFLAWKDAASAITNILELGSDNSVYLLGHATQKTLNFQPNPGTNRLALTDTLVTISAPVNLGGGAAPTVGASQVGLGSTTATTATAGTNGAVPAQVTGYLIINVAGTAQKIPYFNT